MANGIWIEKIKRKLLQLLLGFEHWHISPLQERPYAQDIIKYCNSLPDRNFAVEIGCGLGDIIRNLHFGKRLGLDIDRRVLRAARLLPAGNSSPVVYDTFIFPDSELVHHTDLLIMVNWIHHIEPSILQNKLSDYFNHNLNSGGMIIIDTVQDAAYRFNHDIRYLTKDLNCTIHSIGKYARAREVWLIKK